MNLKTSTDGTNWTTTFMSDTTSASGLTVTTSTLARYVRVETTTVVFLSLYEIVVSGAPLYGDCGAGCSNLAPGKTLSSSGLWNASTNPASKVNDGNTGTTSTCEGSSGYCAIASDSGGGQAVGNYLQIDLGTILSVKSVTVYGRRDTALTQGQNLNLKTSTNGTTWATLFMPDTTSASGLTVSTAMVARYIRVETTAVAFLSLYEIVVTGDSTHSDSLLCFANVEDTFAAIPTRGERPAIRDSGVPAGASPLESIAVPRSGPANGGATAVVRLHPGERYLLAEQSKSGPEGLRFSLSSGTDPRGNPHFVAIAGSVLPVSWTGLYQSLDFIQQCPSKKFPGGHLYMIATYRDNAFRREPQDIADLFFVTFPAGPTKLPALRLVDSKFDFVCRRDGADRCRFGLLRGRTSQ